MKKHTFSLFTGYILLFCPLTGIACASDGYENTLDSLFSSVNRTVEPVFKEERIYNPNTFNYDLSAIDLDIPQTEVPFAPEAFAALDATENIPILELNFSHETTTAAAQTPPAPANTPSEKHPCTAPNCNYATIQRANLTRHIFAHTGEKPHKCPEPDCDYRTATKSNLTRHIRTHTGERPFKCPEPGCIYTAADRSCLARHICAHTRERSHICPEPDCDYRAANRSYLTRHMRNRHPEEHPTKRQRT